MRDDGEVVLSPPRWLRALGGLAGAGFTFVAAVPVLIASTPGAWTASILGVAASVTLAVRMFRVSVGLGAEQLIVRGIFRSRTIPRNSITHVGDDCHIEWRDETGQPRRALVSAFSYTGDVDDRGMGARLARRAMGTIRTWAAS